MIDARTGPHAPPDPRPLAARAVAGLVAPTGVAARRAIPPRRALARTLLGRRAIAAALAAYGALFAAVRADRSAAIDVAVTLRIQRARNPLLERLMGALLPARHASAPSRPRRPALGRQSA